jgi:hypothetical protein
MWVHSTSILKILEVPRDGIKFPDQIEILGSIDNTLPMYSSNDYLQSCFHVPVVLLSILAFVNFGKEIS